MQNSEDYKVHQRHKFSQTFLIFYLEKREEPVSVTLFPLCDAGAGEENPNVILIRKVAFKSF